MDRWICAAAAVAAAAAAAKYPRRDTAEGDGGMEGWWHFLAYLKGEER